MCDATREKVTSILANATEPPPEFPKVNLYACMTCGHTTHTVDVADGVSSMMIPCMTHTQAKIELVTGEKARVCSGQMVSTFYALEWEQFNFDDIEFEWRFATLPEYQRYKSRGIALANHVADGGLVMHPRKNKDAPMLTHGGFFARPDGYRLSDDEAAGLQTGLQTLKEVIRLDAYKAKRKAHSRGMAKHKARKNRKRK